MPLTNEQIIDLIEEQVSESDSKIWYTNISTGTTVSRIRKQYWERFIKEKRQTLDGSQENNDTDQ